MEPLQFPNQDNAFKDMLGTRYWGGVVAHCNLWHAIRIALPSTAWGTANAIVSNQGVVFDFTKMKVPNYQAQRLQLFGASVGGVAKARVSLGYVAGGLADAGMTDPSDSPPFILTFPSAVATLYVYCDVTMSYDTTNTRWSATARSISYASSMPSSTATHLYVQIGAVNVYSNGTGGYTCSVITPQPIKGDQWVARTGNSTTYVDAHGLT